MTALLVSCFAELFSFSEIISPSSNKISIIALVFDVTTEKPALNIDLNINEEPIIKQAIKIKDTIFKKTFEAVSPGFSAKNIYVIYTMAYPIISTKDAFESHKTSEKTFAIIQIASHTRFILGLFILLKKLHFESI